MESITVKGKNNSSTVFVGESFSNLAKYIPPKNVYLITDRNVEAIYRGSFPDFPILSVEPGEGSKSLHTANSAYRWLLEHGADRTSFIVGIGGGVVCDLAGFVASTFMRGVDFGFVATSLLAQVDASVGGKNGVNLDGFKNIVGTFNQPNFVICDIDMLRTLPLPDYSNGLSEVVKHALISDLEKFSFIEKNRQKIRTFDHQLVEFLVIRSVKIKAAIVMADEREKTIRRKLNLGHTWGHAVEKVTGVPHGQAVSIGIVFSANLSVQKGLMTNEERNRVVSLLTDLGLPVSTSANPYVVFETLLKDKKKENDTIHFVLMKGIGEVVVDAIQVDELKLLANL